VNGRLTQRGIHLLLLAAFATACSSLVPIRVVDRNVSFDRTSREALVVFALSPNMVVTLLEGTDDGVSWRCNRWGPEARVRVRAQDGFVVAWLRPKTGKQRYAIESFSTDASGLTAWKTFEQILVFDAVPGQVTYVGALNVEFSGGGIRGINFDPDITYLHAEAFMAGKFANVRAPMAKGRMDWLYMSLDDPCR
jgi:hypothetical protein